MPRFKQPDVMPRLVFSSPFDGVSNSEVIAPRRFSRLEPSSSSSFNQQERFREDEADNDDVRRSSFPSRPGQVAMSQKQKRFNSDDSFTSSSSTPSIPTPTPFRPGSVQVQVERHGYGYTPASVRKGTTTTNTTPRFPPIMKPDNSDNSPGTIAAKAFRRSTSNNAGMPIPLHLEHGNASSLSFQTFTQQQPVLRQRSQSYSHSKNRRAPGDFVASGNGVAVHRESLSHCDRETELPYHLAAYDGIQPFLSSALPLPLPDPHSTDDDGGSNFSEIAEHSFFRDVMDSRRDTSVTLCEPPFSSSSFSHHQVARAVAEGGTVLESPGMAKTRVTTPPLTHDHPQAPSHSAPPHLPNPASPSPPTRSSNHVRISRRTKKNVQPPSLPSFPSFKTPKPKSSLFRIFSSKSRSRSKMVLTPESAPLHQKKRDVAWITGVFLIDPALRVPGGILLFPSVKDEDGEGDSGGAGSNLVLEVENGGIDVEIGLVPEESFGGRGRCARTEGGRTMIELRLLGEGDEVHRCDGMVAEAGDILPKVKLLSKKKKKKGKMDGEEEPFPIIAHIDAPHPRLPFCLFASTVSQPSQRLPATNNLSLVRNVPVPHTSQRSLSMYDPTTTATTTAVLPLSRSSTVTTTTAGKRLSKCTARPYHLPSSLAPPPQDPSQSTPPSPAEQEVDGYCHHHTSLETTFTSQSSQSQPQLGSSHQLSRYSCHSPPAPAPTPALTRSTSTLTPPPTTPPTPQALSRSPIILHLPRSFRGPITISVLGVVEHGGVGAHVRLSAGVEARAVLLWEGEDRQVYFVGGLKEAEAEVGEEEGEVEQEQGETANRPDEVHEQQLRCSLGDTSVASVGKESRKVASSDGGDTIEIKVKKPARYESEHDSSEPCAESGHDDDAGGIGGGGANTSRTGVVCALESDLMDIKSRRQCSAPKPLPSSSATTWRGDKIDLVVGRGKVDLRYVDE